MRYAMADTVETDENRQPIGGTNGGIIRGIPVCECHINNNHGSRRRYGRERSCQGWREAIEGEAEVLEYRLRGLC